jgi:ADP-ribose pyrophosphatase YjhB (NUDIX family)
MKNSLLLFMATLLTTTAVCQQNIDNYSFFKLLVTNEKNEMLLVKWDNQWEIMGERYNQGASISQFVKTMAESMGTEVKDVKLASIFTQKKDTRPNPTIMHYYTARYVKGTIKPPSDCTDIKWFSYDEAMKVIPYEIMRSVIAKIKENPGKVMGAAFHTTVDQTNKTVVSVLEDFYVMN